MFFWKRDKWKLRDIALAKRADLWVKINSDFLDFEPRIFQYFLKQEVLTWLNRLKETNWDVWGEEGDIYGVKFIRKQDAMLFKLIFG